MRVLKRTALIAFTGLALLGAGKAGAAGCNGVVNVFVWGCAPWDNNNGQQFPYYRKKEKTVSAKAVQEVRENMVKVNGQWYPLVNPSSVIAPGGGNIIASGALNLRVWDGK